MLASPRNLRQCTPARGETDHGRQGAQTSDLYDRSGVASEHRGASRSTDRSRTRSCPESRRRHRPRSHRQRPSTLREFSGRRTHRPGRRTAQGRAQTHRAAGDADRVAVGHRPGPEQGKREGGEDERGDNGARAAEGADQEDDRNCEPTGPSATDSRAEVGPRDLPGIEKEAKSLVELAVERAVDRVRVHDAYLRHGQRRASQRSSTRLRQEDRGVAEVEAAVRSAVAGSEAAMRARGRTRLSGRDSADSEIDGPRTAPKVLPATISVMPTIIWQMPP